MTVTHKTRSKVWRGTVLALVGLAASSASAAPNPPPLPLPPKQTGDVKVIKHIKAPPGAPALGSMSFSVTANCTPAAAVPTQSVVAGPGAGMVTFTAPMGATCTIVENTPMPAFPAAAAQFCAASGGVPAWLPPSFHPGTGTVAVNSPLQVVQLRNEWKCAPAPKAKLTVVKRISNPGGTSPLTNMTFNVTANCTSPTSSAVQSINNGTGTGSTTFGVAAGSTCTVTENTPLPAFPASATKECAAMGGVPKWNPPSIYPNNGTVSVPAAGATVYVINSWNCAKNTMGQLEVIKEFNTLQTAVLWPASNWVINVSCTPAASPSTLTISTPASGNAQIVGSGMVSAPTGASCTLSEPASAMPPFPTHIAAYCKNMGGKVPTWNPPVFVPANPIPIGSGVTTVRVKNSWSCV